MIFKKAHFAIVAAFAAATLVATSASADVPNDGAAVIVNNEDNANTTKLYVDNRNPLDVSLYVVTTEGRRESLGIVNGMAQATFALPSWLDDGTKFRIKAYSLGPISPSTHVRRTLKGVKTNVLAASADRTITLRIASDIEKSNIPAGY